MSFEIHAHEADAIVEVVYPAKPTQADVDDYVRRIHTMIEGGKLPAAKWKCLVDQRNLPVLPPELVNQLATLNLYAQRHGMVKSARVVSTVVAGLQAQRMAREGQLPLSSFETREEALAWLRKA